MKFFKYPVLAGLLVAASFLNAAGVVCFRYDDNQSVEIWKTLADVFRKHDARFSFSLIPCIASAENSQWKKLICQLEREGFEIMDHTPQHNTLSMVLPIGSPLLKQLKNASFVDHINGRQVCLKYDLGNSVSPKKFLIDIRDGKYILCKNPAAGLKSRMLLEINGKHYYTTIDRASGGMKLLSIWAEDNVKLPDGDDVTAKWIVPRFKPYPGSYEFMIEQSQAGFRRIGLKKMPKVWIQPGGYYPHFEADTLMEVLKKYGYVSASTVPNDSLKGLHDPNWERNRFAMQWGNFNFEKTLDLKVSKHRIAMATACHRAAIASSHVTPARSGKLKKYAELHDELLAWLKKNNIKVMTQSDLAVYLKNHRLDPDANVMPSFTRDIDEDGLPDGYSFNKGAVFADGVVKLSGKGHLFCISRLCGLPHGRVRFSAGMKGVFNGNIKFTVIDGLKRRSQTRLLPVKISNSDFKTVELIFDIPANAQALQFEVNSIDVNTRADLKDIILKAASR